MPDYTDARRIIAEGGTVAAAAKAAGVSVRTIRRRLATEPEAWPRPDETARALAALTATANARRRWAERRADLADTVGDTVAAALDAVTAALTAPEPDGRNAKDLALAFAILTDKADRLGGAGDGTTDAAARLAAVLDVAIANPAHPIPHPDHAVDLTSKP